MHLVNFKIYVNPIITVKGDEDGIKLVMHLEKKCKSEVEEEIKVF